LAANFLGPVQAFRNHMTDVPKRRCQSNPVEAAVSDLRGSRR
jgi:hypothetical protein